jgi:hypothetical protein
MNARKEIREHLIAIRMRYWHDVARCPLVNIRVPTWRARKNFWALVRKYPTLAARLGLSEVSVFNVREGPAPEPPDPDKTSEAHDQPPAAAPAPACASPAVTRGVPRLVLLDDEVV